jgi:hypothetical protein
MLYTVTTDDGFIIARSVTAVMAAHAIMGPEAEIRPYYRVDGRLYNGLQTADMRAADARRAILAERPINAGHAAELQEQAAAIVPTFAAWHMCRANERTPYSSTAVDYDTAELDIALEILEAAPGWRRPYQIEPD